jgi:uncharacterized protein YaiL (DUF2058 family)
MLDLKEKLLKAGLVTADQVKKVEDEEAAKKQKKKQPKVVAVDEEAEKIAKRENAIVESERWRKRLTELAAAGKAEQYEAIRGWVTRHRLDNKQITDAAERFHFARADGSVGHLTVEPDVKAQLSQGAAAVVTFMGFNGLEHAVVPKDVALDIQVVKPEWIVSDIGSSAPGAPASTT